MLRLWSLSWILHWLQATFSQAWSPCLYQKKLSSLWFLRNTKHEKILKTYLSFFVMFLIQIFVPINVKIMFFLIISSPYYCRSNKIRAYVNKKCILRLSKMVQVKCCSIFSLNIWCYKKKIIFDQESFTFFKDLEVILWKNYKKSSLVT